MNLLFKQKAGRILIIALVAYLSILAAKNILAEFQFTFAKNNLDFWSQIGELPSEDAYREAKAAISLATSLDSSNPEFIDTEASLLIWGYYEEFETEEVLNTALSAYEESLKLRPLWPWTWQEWVMTKWRLEQYDEAMLAGLERLAQVGPYTHDANLTVVDAGLGLLIERPDFEDRLAPLIELTYNKAKSNPKIRPQMQEIREFHEAEWLPEL